MKRIFVFMFVLMLSLNLFAEKVVQIKGSDTMINLGQAMIENYMSKNPGKRISITGGGSGTGIAALLNKNVDIAQASRSISPKELEMAKQKGIIIKEYTIAFDGIAVIINPTNNVTGLSSEQIREIYLGKIKNWKEVGGPDKKITILSRDSNSGTHLYFKEHILRKGNEKGPEEYCDSTLFMPTTQAVVDEIAKNDGAIGYIGLGYIDNKIKVLKVDGVIASVETVKNKTYPISRGLFWYIDGEPEKNIKSLVDFAFSKTGQEIVAKEGFVSIK